MLGCGVYEVSIAERGGRRLVIPSVPFTGVQWGRRYGDTSEASVDISPESCRDVLSRVEPWVHEARIQRDARVVWEGPVTSTATGFSIGARDVSTWLDRRMVRRSIRLLRTDLALIGRALVDEAMRSDPSPGIVVEATPAGLYGDREFRAGQHPMIGEPFRELARSGVAWTVVGRTIHISRPAAEATVAVHDDDFLGSPQVNQDGVETRNAIGIRGSGQRASSDPDDPIYAEARDEVSIAKYGLLEDVETEDTVIDVESARAAALTRVARRAVAVATFNSGRLAGTSSVAIEQLVPGAVVAVDLAVPSIPVRGLYRLETVQVTAGTNVESVTITVAPMEAGGVAT